MRGVLPPLILLLTAAVGCTTTRDVHSVRQAALIDSLYTVNAELREQLYALQDTFKFYDAIDSGRFYREQRQLQDRINRLEYELGLARDGGYVVTTLLVDDLFEPASARLTAAGNRTLDELAARLARDFEGRIFRIEGYTDNVPLGPNLKDRYPSNWELSAARAAAVARYLIAEHDMLEDRFEVVAFGPTQPVDRNDTAEGRRQNRRIRLLALSD